MTAEPWASVEDVAKGVFQIRYTADNDYEPDFVLETGTEMLHYEYLGDEQ